MHYVVIFATKKWSTAKEHSGENIEPVNFSIGVISVIFTMATNHLAIERVSQANMEWALVSVAINVYDIDNEQ